MITVEYCFGGAFSTLKIETQSREIYNRGLFQQLQKGFFLFSDAINTLKIDRNYIVLHCL